MLKSSRGQRQKRKKKSGNKADNENNVDGFQFLLKESVFFVDT